MGGLNTGLEWRIENKDWPADTAASDLSRKMGWNVIPWNQADSSENKE